MSRIVADVNGGRFASAPSPSLDREEHRAEACSYAKDVHWSFVRIYLAQSDALIGGDEEKK